MAKVELSVAIENELNQAGVSRVEGNAFGGVVRNMDQGDPYEVGDTFTIPENYKENILQTVIGSGENATSAKFIMVETKNAETGAEKNIRFFPNQLAKILFPVDENGKRLPKVKTSGTAAKHYANFQDIDAAMESLKGKSIRVVKDDTYRTLRYGTNEVVNSHIYGYDLVLPLATLGNRLQSV